MLKLVLVTLIRRCISQRDLSDCCVDVIAIKSMYASRHCCQTGVLTNPAICIFPLSLFYMLYMLVLWWQRKSLLEVIKQTVLDHLTKKCPPHVSVVSSAQCYLLICVYGCGRVCLLTGGVAFYKPGPGCWTPLPDWKEREQAWIVAPCSCWWRCF